MHRVAAILTSASLCGLAFAQQGGQRITVQQDNPPIRQDGQPVRREGGPAIAPPGGGRGMMGGRMMGRMVEELDLDENQQKIYEELAAPMRERMRTMGERWRAAREAADAGDDTQLKAMQSEFQQNGGRGGPFGGADPFGEIFEQLEPHLRPEQVEKLDTMRDRMERDRESMDAYRRVSEDLPEKLNLDETQKQQFDEMLQAAREEVGQKWQAMRPMFDQMQEAREAGDNERLAELRRQFEQQRPDGAAQMQGLMSQIEGLLRDDQNETFNAFQTELGLNTGGDAADAGGSTDVRSILRLAKRLRMTSEQKDDFKDIEKSSMRALRRAGRDADAKAQLADRVKEQIEQILDETQRERFHAQLERLDRRSRR